MRPEPAQSESQATFLVLHGGECVPADGPLQVEELRGEFYVLGHCSWQRYESRGAAERRLREMVEVLDPHRIAAETVEALADGSPAHSDHPSD
jgi:hypothetical protein